MAQTLRPWIASLFEDTQSLCFSSYMQTCLYHPVHGYYTKALARQGASGDYYTAPSMGPLFARTLALHLTPLLQANPSWRVAEIGPGRGDLCASLSPILYDTCKTDYLCIEPYKACWPMQKQRISQSAKHHSTYVSFSTSLPSNFQGIVLANEVLDAQPCHILKRLSNGSLRAMHVCLKHDTLSWCFQPLSEWQATTYAVRKLPKYHDYQYELSDYSIIASLAKKLSSGYIYFFDYGYPRSIYYHPERSHGTLSCYYQHTTHSNPLAHPGDEDITAHVDFTEVAHTAYSHKFQIDFFTNLEQFLTSQGIASAYATLSEQTPVSKHLALSRYHLLHPDAMGETMKVMRVSKGMTYSSHQFSSIDCTHRL